MPISLIYALRNVAARKISSGVTMVGVAVSVMVFIVMSSTADSIARVAVSTGSPRNVLVLANGASSAEISFLELSELQRARLVSGLAVDRNGDPLASVEYLLTRTLRRPGEQLEGGSGRFVTLRGVTPRAFDVHDGVKIEQGRYPVRSGEMLIGSLVARKLGLGIGDEISLDALSGVICGTLSAAGQVFAGEVWIDLGDLQSRLGQSGASALVLRVADGGDPEAVIRTLETSPGLNVSARSEAAYYREIQQVSGPFAGLANFVGLILGLGAVLAGTNTLYAAMSRRTRELGTLRALGFGRWFVAGTVLLESILTGLLGGLVGSGLALLFDGFALNLMGLSFELTVETRVLLQGSLLSILVGLFGGALPARAALRLRIIEALRQA